MSLKNTAVGWHLCLCLCLTCLAPDILRAESECASATQQHSRQRVYRTVVEAEQGPRRPALSRDRARSEVTREDLARRLPRSAPDALRFEPGVFVQQTAHSQGSAFIRGLTGQQTLLLFDGIRLNNSTFRQGPNQYFFTLDAKSIDSIQVVRGGASTRYGSDALGGVILTLPIEPEFDSSENALLRARPGLHSTLGTADSEIGGRVKSNLTFGKDVAVFVGAGARQTSLLESAGPVLNPADGQLPEVPRFAEDGRRQLGTGFKELTADAHGVYKINQNHRLKLASYLYRQFDAPRTDHCPAPLAPHDECLLYDEQFRSLVYGVWEARFVWALLHDLRSTISWQRQHERRSYDRPSSRVSNIGRDNVTTFGASSTARSAYFRPGDWLRLRLFYGVDSYHDRIESAAWIRFSDIEVTRQRSRGQYLDGSTYTSGGIYVDTEASVGYRFFLQAGARWSWVMASAPQDSESGSRSIERSWFPLVGHAGWRWQILAPLNLLLNVDRSFRTPNLDDMTARQQTGPGFQFENPALQAEVATTLEAGLRITLPVQVELWAYSMVLENAVGKKPQDASECPPETEQCRNSWHRYQLANAAKPSTIIGVEGVALLELPRGLRLRNTIAWTWGQGPNLADPPTDSTLAYAEWVPLSRIPPLNGTLELVWKPSGGLMLSGAMRWAARQDRLAIADRSDGRIPLGGTPGFSVFDARIGYRWRNRVVAALVLENLADTPYRYHGSSVNGAGRSLLFSIDAAALPQL